MTTKVIKNGTVCTADRTWKADVLIEGETIKQIGEGLKGDEYIDAEGALCDPRRHRPAYPSGNALHGHHGGGDLRDRHLGRGLWRHDDAGGFLPARRGWVDQERDQRVAPQIRTADLRRYRLSHGDHRLERETSSTR